jgi:hypothetical protein
MTTFNRTIYSSILAITVLLLTCCQVTLQETTKKSPVPTLEETTVERIYQNQVVTYQKNLRMTAGNFLEQETYINAGGVSQQGPTALLRWWIDHESELKQDRVHVGQEIVFEPFQIRILKIDQDTAGKYVEVAIKVTE